MIEKIQLAIKKYNEKIENADRQNKNQGLGEISKQLDIVVDSLREIVDSLVKKETLFISKKSGGIVAEVAKENISLELEKQLKIAIDNLDRFKMKNQQLETQLAETTLELKQAADLSGKVKTSEEKLFLIKNENMKLKQNFEELSKKNLEIIFENENLTKEKNDYVEKINTLLENEYSTNNEQIMEVEQNRNSIKGLTNQNQKLLEDFQNLQNEFSEIENLKDEIQKLNLDLEIEKNYVSNLKVENEQLKEKLENEDLDGEPISNHLNFQSNLESNFNLGVSRLQSELPAEKFLNEKKPEIEMDDKTTETDLTYEEILSYEKKIKDTEKKIQASDLRIQVLEIKIKQLQKQLASELEKTIQDPNIKVEKVEDGKNNLKNKEKEFENSLNSLKEELKEKNFQLEKALKKTVTSSEEAKSKTIQINVLRTKLERSNQDLSELKREFEIFSKELEKNENFESIKKIQNIKERFKVIIRDNKTALEVNYKKGKEVLLEHKGTWTGEIVEDLVISSKKARRESLKKVKESEVENLTEKNSNENESSEEGDMERERDLTGNFDPSNFVSVNEELILLQTQIDKYASEIERKNTKLKSMSFELQVKCFL